MLAAAQHPAASAAPAAMASPTFASDPSSSIIARAVAHARTDWIVDGEGKWSLPLAFLPRGEGWVELMRVAPGVRIAPHRHSGPVHALNLQGSRLLSDGRHIEAGDYVHEPTGNVDWWEATGEAALIVQVVVMGHVEYLDAEGQVLRRITAADRLDAYLAHCIAHGIAPNAELSA